ncbi:MAG: imidazole glycerol phosphate synthase subunit HisH [Acidobacteria bacterium]|nr:imidazole glycerol phosphate synthase subunit HisH [Acidobacteriota bacterium]
MRVAIVDYHAGNLASVSKAFDRLGARIIVTSEPEVTAAADKIVLPGVGHFAATRALEDCGLRSVICNSIEAGVPFLGICVGMQWLLCSSEEAPGRSGLGLWAGECSRFPASVRCPHVGWNSLHISSSDSRLLRGIGSGAYVYFTHSYRVPLLAATVAECYYGGAFSAAVEQQNLYGVQFHPEKSGDVGLRVLENFLAC